MRRLFAIAALIATVFATSNGARAYTTPQAQSTPKAMESKTTRNSLLGEVVAVDTQKKRLTLKTADAKQVNVNLDDQTVYRRVPPGETTLEKATTITLEDISLGDRVSARGEISDNAMLGRALIVMSRKDISQKKEQDKADWQRRGIAGTIVSISPEAREFVLKARTPQGGMSLMLVSAGAKNLRVRRYAPGSIKFADARPSSFDELKVGDLVRALGNRSSDNTSFTAEEIVAGAFRVVGGKITAINQATGEITINDLQTQQPLTIAINTNSMVRRIPAEMLALMEQNSQGGGGAPGTTMVMTPDGPRIMKRPDGAASPGGGPVRRSPGGGGGGQRVIMTPDGQRHIIPEGKSPEEVVGARGNVDPQEAIERLPAITISNLKTGDGIIVLSTREADPSRATAIIVAAGVESFLTRQQEAKATRPGYQLDLALPGIGAP